MKSPLEFFDEFQKRIDDIYATKFFIDEAAKANRPRNGGEFDGSNLCVDLVMVHDYIRNLPFEQIMLKTFVAETHANAAKTPQLTQFYNVYSKISFQTTFSIPEFLARHLVENVARPVSFLNPQSVPVVLDHNAVMKKEDVDKIIKGVEHILTIHPYIAFIYALSLTETNIPKPGS